MAKEKTKTNQTTTPATTTNMNAEEQQQMAMTTATVTVEPLPRQRKPVDMTELAPKTDSDRTNPVGYAKGPVYLPASLRNVTFDPSRSSKDRISSYGKWDCEILRDCSLGWGHFAKKGDVVTLIGDVARDLCLLGQAQFVDPKLLEEKRILEEADKIRKTNPRRLDPERFTPAKKKNPWLSGVLQSTPANS